MFNINCYKSLTHFIQSTRRLNWTSSVKFSTQTSSICIIKLTPYTMDKHFNTIKKLQCDNTWINKVSDSSIEITNHFTSVDNTATDVLSLERMFNTILSVYKIANIPDISISGVKFLLKCDSKDKYISGELVEKYITDIFYDAANP